MNIIKLVLLLTKKRNFLFIILFILSFVLKAQTPEHRRYGRKDGLNTTGFIFDIGQDKDGTIWLSHNRGVNSFNGESSKSYGKLQTIPEQPTLRCFQGPFGMTFIGYNGSLSYFKNGKFISYPTNEESKNQLRRGISFGAKSYGENQIIVSSRNGCFLVDSLARLTFIKENNDGDNGGGVFLSNKTTQPVGFTVNDSILSLNNSYSLTIYDSLFHPLYSIQIVKTLPSKYDQIYTYWVGNNNFAISWGNHLIIANADTILQHRVLDHKISSIAVDKENTLWAVKQSKGVYSFPNGDINTSNFTEHFKTEELTAIYSDEEGGVWLAAYEDALLYIPSTLYQLRNTGVYSKISAILVNDEKTIIGQQNGMLTIIENGIKTQYDIGSIVPDIGNSIIRELCLDSINNELLITIFDRLFTLSSDGRLSEVKQKKLFDGRIRQIIPSRFGNNYWLVGAKSISKIRNGKIVKTLPNIDYYIYRLLEVAEDELWIARKDALWKYESGVYTNYASKHDMYKGTIEDVAILNDLLWVSNTTKGTGVFKQDTLIEIFNNEVIRFSKVENDTLWGICHGRINKFYEVHDSIIHYATPLSYMITTEIYGFQIVGNLFHFVTSKGLISIPRASINKIKDDSRTLITKLELNFKDTLVQNYHELSYDQNNLAINFHTATFKSKKKILYRYRMLGVNDEWRFTKKKSIQYVQLSPGEYRFEVSGKNHDGVWTEDPAHVSFVILPPLWATWWFRLLSTIIILSVFYLMYRKHIKKVKKEQQIENQLLQLESKALRAQMNPHFIFNVLGAIQGYISEGNITESEVYLGNFARLIRMILQNSRHSFVLLEDELKTLQYYMDMEQMRFANKFAYHVYLDENIDPSFVKIPPMLIQPYLENAIVHGIGNSNKGEINLKIRQEGSILRCEIIDNGVGRKNKSLKENPIKAYKPLGMLITKERFELMQGNKSNKVGVKVEKIYNNTSESNGTKVILEVPTK
ncbi:MAG: histidine kinase [Flavobacteriales bacterium]|nr:histidine kinase [Flavobacteriales bacterium]